MKTEILNAHLHKRMLCRRGMGIDLKTPRLSDIDLPEIAHALGHICRYTGHTPKYYSVAEHSLWCMRLGERILGSKLTLDQRAALLLHDAHEAFVGDLSRPMFDALPDDARNAITSLKQRWDRVIANKLILRPEIFSDPFVTFVDRQMLAIEMWTFWPKARPTFAPLHLMCGPAFQHWTPTESARQFILACHEIELIK